MSESWKPQGHRDVAPYLLVEDAQEPVRGEGDPDRRCGFEDPAGNSWWVSTQAGG